jgi:SGNH hydrolase-like domain, acetyltransferase AlgX
VGRQRDSEGEEGSYNDLLDISGRARFTDSEIQTWVERIKRRQAIVESRGGRYLFAVGPRKATVYPEYLPELVFRSRGETRLEQLTKALKTALPEVFIDLTSELKTNKSVGAYPRLYYRTDAHWNYYGAYFAYAAYMNRAAAFFERSTSVPLSSFRVGERENWYHRGFFTETRLLEKESFPILYPSSSSPYVGVKVINSKHGFVEEGNDEISAGKSLPLTEVGIGVADMPAHRVRFLKQARSGGCRYLKNDSESVELTHLILLGDSFLQKAAPYFAAHAKHTYFCRQTAAMKLPVFDKKLNEEIKTQLVIQELTEAYLGK